MTRAALRFAGVAFAATANCRVASPCPFDGPWITIHAAVALAFQEHSRSVSILIVPLPPDEANAEAAPLAVTAHFETELLGPTTVVDVEDDAEHPATSAATMTRPV